MAIFVSTNWTGSNWVNSIANDIALVPETTNLIVSVNNINGGCAVQYHEKPASYPQYYLDNEDPTYQSLAEYAAPGPVFNVQYDGLTVSLTARSRIAANIIHHIKIAVADYGDAYLDSAIFLKSWTPCQ